MSENRMTATPGYYPDGRYGEPDEPAPDDEYWDEDEPILATESELAYWRKRNQHRPATESEDRMKRASREQVEIVLLGAWVDEHDLHEAICRDWLDMQARERRLVAVVEAAREVSLNPCPRTRDVLFATLKAYDAGATDA
jgi:hypothetical protein